MKQFSIILNFILVIAVAILYYLHFKGNKNDGGSASLSNNTTTVFVNSDSLTVNYELYKEKRAELQAEGERMQEALKEDGGKLQSQIEDFQKKASVMSKVERDANEKRLQEEQQQFYQKRDQLSAALEEKKDKTNEEIYSHLTSFIKDYIKKKGLNYNFILGYQKGGTIIYAKDSLDITPEIIQGLNDEYKKDNPLGK